jgi:hypothetical protein
MKHTVTIGLHKMWPPLSPSLTHADFYFGGSVKEKVYSSSICHALSLCPRAPNVFAEYLQMSLSAHCSNWSIFLTSSVGVKCQSSALIASISSDILCAKRHIIILCVTVQFWRLISGWYIFLCKAKSNKLKIWRFQSSRICCYVFGEMVHLTLENDGITFLCGTGKYSSKDAASHPRRWEFWITLLLKS